jgi:hypothetical protein
MKWEQRTIPSCINPNINGYCVGIFDYSPIEDGMMPTDKCAKCEYFNSKLFENEW